MPCFHVYVFSMDMAAEVRPWHVLLTELTIVRPKWLDQDGSPHAFAFVIPQDLPMGHQQRDLLQYLTTIAKIERDTGVSFFSDLPLGTRTRVENDLESRMW